MMTEKENSAADTHIQHPRKTVRILISLAAVCLLILSIIIVLSTSQRVHPISHSSASSPSSTPIYLDTPPAQAEFYDTFKNNAQHWSVSNTSGYIRSIHAGGLILTNTNRGTTLVESLPTNSVFANCTVTVDLTMLKTGLNDSVGIFIRGDTNLEHDYRIDLYGNGNYAISKEYLNSQNNPQTIILARSNINSFLKPIGKHISLSLTMNGSQFRLYINNIEIGIVTDSDYASGQVALFAQLDKNSSDEITAMFSKVEIDKISGAPSAEIWRGEDASYRRFTQYSHYCQHSFVFPHG